MNALTSTLTLFLTEIPASDWPGMVRWYVDVLGLRLSLEDRERRYALLEAGAGRLALKGYDAVEQKRGVAVRLVFEVAEVAAEAARLAGRGVAVSPPEDNPEGYRAIHLHDPEGTPIDLFCWTARAGRAEIAEGRRAAPPAFGDLS